MRSKDVEEPLNIDNVLWVYPQQVWASPPSILRILLWGNCEDCLGRSQSLAGLKSDMFGLNYLFEFCPNTYSGFSPFSDFGLIILHLSGLGLKFWSGRFSIF